MACSILPFGLDKMLKIRILKLMKVSTWIVCSFYFIGAPIGALVFAHLIGFKNDDPTMFLAIFFGYGIAIVPALLASTVDIFIIYRLDDNRRDLSLWVAVSIGVISASLSALILSPFVFSSLESWGLETLLGYFLVFIIPSVVCGLFNKPAWETLIK